MKEIVKNEFQMEGTIIREIVMEIRKIVKLNESISETCGLGKILQH